ncbi:MAG: tRNA lysidine(34) synthetase TilS [Chloroflexota bacterium]
MNACSRTLEEAVLGMDIPSHSRLLIAVSGGPDSIALLDVLYRLSRQSNHHWVLMVGHINHGLRGTESDVDEAFVRHMADRLDLLVDVAHVETLTFAESCGISEELAARELRYSALSDMLRQWPGDKIVIGHTADDQAETVIMHLLRGSGVTGLAGMRPQRGRILRPFLSVRHDTILSALQEQNLGYRLDSSNLNERHFRNRIRRTAMPSLLQAAPHAVDAIGRTAKIVQHYDTYFDQEVAQFLSTLDVATGSVAISADSSVWLIAHSSLQRAGLRALHSTVGDQRSDLTYDHVLAMEEAIRGSAKRSPTALHLPGGVTFVAARRRFTFTTSVPHLGEPLDTTELTLPGTADLPVGQFHAHVMHVVSRDELEMKIMVCGPLHALCDAATLDGQVIIRSRLPGDRIEPLGMRGSKKVQDILVDAGIPEGERNRIPIVADQTGIVWVPGYRVARRVQIAPESEDVVHIQFSPTFQNLP